MDGVILYSTKQGSTAQYAEWISQATGLPHYNVNEDEVDLSAFDFFVLGAPVYYYKVWMGNWLNKHRHPLADKPVVFFTVSGAPPGAKLDGWISQSLPEDLFARMYHVPLRGRQNPKNLSWFHRAMLLIASVFNRDRTAAREEREGFDYMDQASIAPIVERVELLQGVPTINPMRTASA